MWWIIAIVVVVLLFAAGFLIGRPKGKPDKMDELYDGSPMAREAERQRQRGSLGGPGI